MEYLYENKQFRADIDRAEWETTVANYMKKYIGSSRKNPFFSLYMASELSDLI